MVGAGKGAGSMHTATEEESGSVCAVQYSAGIQAWQERVLAGSVHVEMSASSVHTSKEKAETLPPQRQSIQVPQGTPPATHPPPCAAARANPDLRKGQCKKRKAKTQNPVVERGRRIIE